MGCILAILEASILKIFRGSMPPDPPRTLPPAALAKNAFGILFSPPNRKNAARSLLLSFLLAYLKADLKGFCSSLIKSLATLVMKRMDAFREMTLVICSGNCLQECELKHLSVPEGLRWSDLYTYCTRLYVAQPWPSVLCSRDDF